PLLDGLREAERGRGRVDGLVLQVRREQFLGERCRANRRHCARLARGWVAVRAHGGRGRGAAGEGARREREQGEDGEGSRDGHGEAPLGRRRLWAPASPAIILRPSPSKSYAERLTRGRIDTNKFDGGPRAVLRFARARRCRRRP